MKPIGWIYLTTNIVNGKIYVGKHEISKDKKLNATYIGSGRIFKRAFYKYGEENFKRKILRLCYSLHELRIWEHVYIVKYKSYIRSIGYNIAKGDVNTSEYNPSKIPEVREKIKAKIKERGGLRGANNPNFGNKWNEKSRVRLSKSLKHSYKVNGHPREGKKHSEETKRKMSEAKKGKYIGSKNHSYGKHLSESTKEKIRAKNLGKKLSEEHKSKISKKIRGENNPMYGSTFIWINNGIVNKRGKIDEPIPEGWEKGMICGIQKK